MKNYASIVFSLLLLTTYIYSSVPDSISYQARVKQDGILVNGIKDIEIRIYNSQSGGMLVWQKDFGNVQISSGVFMCMLDVATVDWRDKDFWIETVIQGEPISNRKQITSQVYALHSKTTEDISRDSSNNATNIVEKYDPITNKYTSKKSININRSECAVSAIDNKIYVIGGTNSNEQASSNVEQGYLIYSNPNPSSGLSQAICYPTVLNTSKSDKMRFEYFTPGTTIRIISPAGYIIKTLETDEQGNVPGGWDGRAGNGKKIGSGIYIIHASNSSGNTKLFKVFILN